MEKKFLLQSMGMRNAKKWIKDGRQIGARFNFIDDGLSIWSSVGIQFHNQRYKVFADEIEEKKMASEEYRLEIENSFSDLNEALDFIANNTRATLDMLKPCKGQKIFNPDLIN